MMCVKYNSIKLNILCPYIFQRMSRGNSGGIQIWRLMCKVWVWAISCSILVLSRINLTRIARGLISFWNHISETKILNWFSSSWAQAGWIWKNISNFEAWTFCAIPNQIFISNKIKTLPQFTSWWVDYFSVCSVIALLMSSNFQTRLGTRHLSRQRAAPAV